MCPVPFSAHQLNLARRGPVVMKFYFLTSEERLSEIKVAEDWGLESKPHDWNWGHVQGTRLHQLLERTKILLPRKEYLFNKFSHTVRETQKLPGDCPVYASLWSNFTSKISFETPTSHGGHQFLCPLSILPGLSEWLSVPFKTELRQDEGQLLCWPVRFFCHLATCKPREALLRGCSCTLHAGWAALSLCWLWVACISRSCQQAEGQKKIPLKNMKHMLHCFFVAVKKTEELTISEFLEVSKDSTRIKSARENTN